MKELINPKTGEVVQLNLIMSVWCEHCYKEFDIEVNAEDYLRWRNGAGLIQNILWYLTREERELLISGTCNECWNKMFPAE